MPILVGTTLRWMQMSCPVESFFFTKEIGQTIHLKPRRPPRRIIGSGSAVDLKGDSQHPLITRLPNPNVDWESPMRSSGVTQCFSAGRAFQLTRKGIIGRLLCSSTI